MRVSDRPPELEMKGIYQRKVPLFARLTALTLLFALLLTSTVLAAEPPKKPSITADSAIVIDYDTGEVLYEKDADTMRVPASMTKVMTAYIIFEELEAGNLTLDTMVPVSKTNADRSRSSNYPAIVPLPYGQSQSVDTLLKLILIPSASASCIVMADYISGSEEAFVQRMNETAKRLGITAQYKNCHGAHVHYLTARSQAILVREFISRFPQVLEYTSMTGVTFNGKYYPNTNKLLPGLDYAYDGVDGFKTGTITAAGYCLSATAVKNGRRIISVVMHSNDDKTRHTDSAAILDYGFAMLEYQSPYADVAYHWSREDVAALKELGAELHPDGESFRPEDNVTRAEFAAMLYTALEQSGALPEAPSKTTEEAEAPLFADIEGHWAQAYIEQAAELELISGIGTDAFSPDRSITRQEMMVLIDRCVDLPDENGLGFSDDSEIAFWALEAAARTAAAGLFQGDNNKLMPNDTASRAQAAAVINWVLALAA